MAAFQFYTMSGENQAALRNNPRRCVALLRPCKPLADRLSMTGGIYAPLSADDELLLQDFHLVAQSFQNYQHEGAFDGICQQAGLLHSDAGLLEGRVETLYRQREPALYEAETISILEQWLHNEEKEGEE
ncbi:MAG: hypothetical protein ACRDIV_17750 [Ktedonobacteraceae bacterium]